jgi:acyl-CoA synthetase (AMP-forming)/AMP-acid ligase II
MHHPFDPDETLPRVLTAAAARLPDSEAVVDGERRSTFADLAAQADQFAGALIASGIEPGDRVAIWAPNSAEWIAAAFGVWGAGAVLVPLNTRYRGGEAGYIVGTAGAKLLFASHGFLDDDHVGMLETAGRPACLEEIVLLHGERDGCAPLAAFLARSDAVSCEAAVARSAAVRPEDLANILFTSGTTGRPKGAMLRHGATVRAYGAWADVVGLREGDRYLVVYPFFHSAGLNSGIVACILRGATIIPHAVFDALSVMRRVEEERVTMLPGTPAVFQTILDHPDLGAHDLSSLRLCVTGAAVVPVEMIKRMYVELPFETIVTGYGLTEATGIATMCRHDDDPETIATRCGRPIPEVEVNIVDASGRQTPPGEPGEVLVRGYNVMAGYFGDPESTSAAVDAEGWLRTGDIGILDDRGYLRITDRIKDMFIVGGFNAYPAEIEQIILEHSSISQVAVVGVPDERLGEVGKAFVVLRRKGEFDQNAFVSWCRERMANFKVPRHVEIVDALPLNASGKVLKYELRELS